MTLSTLDTTPQAPAWGVASNAETPAQLGYTAAGQAFHRATQPNYGDWLDHVRAAAGCTRPIRLTGNLYTLEPGTGRILDERSTAAMPDGAIYKGCGNRRGSVCPACSRVYQGDAYQILHTFLVGGKGIPATVARHPAVFATLTAPSFGTVHTRVVGKHTCVNRKRCDCRPEPCHARRDTGLCEHGRPAVCWARHERTDAILGRPLCLDCYDHDHQVVWNISTGALWHRTKQAAERYLVALCRRRRIPFHVVFTETGRTRRVPPVKLSHGKAAELQARGAVHFHALLRIDGVDPYDPDAVIPPPAGIDVGDLVDALDTAARHTALTTPPHPDRPEGWPITWGDPDKGLDFRPITLAGDGDITDGMAAGYLAKYATKSTEATGHTSTRITPDNVDDHADPDGDHIARLIDACWRIGRPTHTPAPLADRPRIDRPEPGFIARWECPDCGTHTRYPACPVCIAECQAILDSQPAKRVAATDYTRLRRAAHMLGFGGHFLTKTRRRVIAFRLLRESRITYRRATDHEDQAATVIRLADHIDEETTLIVGTLTFAGAGWHTTGDALLANTAADLARSRRQAGREELAHELGTTTVGVASAAA
ncbi:replication initiator [Asanoa sp. NPDC049518]|uniref:replication initiator n=1 Tax=unclassified Asanoa TaxID=2685164 RepID=UPI00343E26A1